MDLHAAMYGYTQFGFGYACPMDSEPVQAALAQLLTHVPVLCGKASLINEGRAVSVKWHAGQGVDLITATANLTLDEFILPTTDNPNHAHRGSVKYSPGCASIPVHPVSATALGRGNQGEACWWHVYT